jgi:nitrogen fixation NifU-like protein
MSPQSANLGSLYRELILSNAAAPCGHEKDIAATHEAAGHNPLCGDEVTVLLQVIDAMVVDAAFQGESCAICTASVSLLCRHLPGQPVAAIAESWAGFKAALDQQGSTTVADNAKAQATGTECPDFMRPMLGVAQYPARIACAELPWATARRALQT